MFVLHLLLLFLCLVSKRSIIFVFPILSSQCTSLFFHLIDKVLPYFSTAHALNCLFYLLLLVLTLLFCLLLNDILGNIYVWFKGAFICISLVFDVLSLLILTIISWFGQSIQFFISSSFCSSGLVIFSEGYVAIIVIVIGFFFSIVIVVFNKATIVIISFL